MTLEGPGEGSNKLILPPVVHQLLLALTIEILIFPSTGEVLH